MSNNQNRGNIGANFHQPYFPQPSFNQGHNNNSILGTNPNSIPNPNLPNRPQTTNGNTDIRSRFRLPFEPTTGRAPSQSIFSIRNCNNSLSQLLGVTKTRTDI